jgi:glutamate-1-semialdehyde 2,1-aminomutase
MLDQTRSQQQARRLARLVPGGAHTYAKGPDQFPADIAPIIARGRGSHVWDVDGNEFVEYGSGLRSVALGHAHPAVLEAVRSALETGTNFARPSTVELAAAEAFLEAVPTAEMVKFAKNGSDATTAAVRLARAVTGRDMVAVCRDQPFFSTDDWFIGVTGMPAGVPQSAREATVTFPYGDLPAVAELLAAHGSRLAALVMEVATTTPPPAGYLSGLKTMLAQHGVLLVFDEMITGFRWDLRGAQGMYGVTPDLSTFGKAMGNGFAVSALAGRRDLMERGGLDHDQERVFLLSTTHGAETHALAAAMAVIEVHRREGVAARLDELGRQLRTQVRQVLHDAGLADRILLRGQPCNLVFATLDAQGNPSQEFRTLFLRELLLRGVLAPSFVVSAALDSGDLEQTAQAVAGAAVVYAQALDHGSAAPWTGGRSVKPVMRRFA